MINSPCPASRWMPSSTRVSPKLLVMPSSRKMGSLKTDRPFLIKNPFSFPAGPCQGHSCAPAPLLPWVLESILIRYSFLLDYTGSLGACQGTALQLVFTIPVFSMVPKKSSPTEGQPSPAHRRGAACAAPLSKNPHMGTSCSHEPKASRTWSQVYPNRCRAATARRRTASSSRQRG